MYSVEHHTGKLCEVRLATPISEAELQSFVHDLTRVVGGISGKYVGVTDLMEAHLFPPNVTQMMIQYLSSSSPRVVRSGILIGEGATFALQVERVLRSSNNDNRRAFRRVDELETWLGEVLSMDERVRLRRFLSSRKM